MPNNHEQIKQWIREGEGSQLEFKTQVPDTWKIAKTICAFANTRGGHIVVGVMDNGEIVGIIDQQNEINKLKAAAYQYCYPAVDIEFEIYTDNYLPILVVKVSEGHEKPYRALHQNGKDIAYVRVRDKTLIASRAVEKSLLNEPVKTNDDNNDTPQRTLNSKEQGLINYLEKREQITLKEFMQLMNLSKRRARRLLVDLVREGILRIHDHSGDEYYTLS